MMDGALGGELWQLEACCCLTPHESGLSNSGRYINVEGWNEDGSYLAGGFADALGVALSQWFVMWGDGR